MKILQYLKGTKDLGVKSGGKRVDGVLMSAYANADHATCADSRRSVSGGAIMLDGAAISYFSCTQEVTAVATSESEYVVMGEGVGGDIFLRQVQKFIMPSMEEYSIPVMEDKQRAIKLVNNPFASKRIRHIDTKHNFFRDAVEDGKVNIVNMKTAQQHTDVLTKVLDSLPKNGPNSILVVLLIDGLLSVTPSIDECRMGKQVLVNFDINTQPLFLHLVCSPRILGRGGG